MSNNLFDTIIAQGHVKKKTEKQQKIIDTAIQLFAEKGYSNTSTAEIAKIAQVSEGTIFKHFGTKDHLLLSDILPFIKEFSPAIAHDVLKNTVRANTTTFEQFLRVLLKDRFDFIAANKEVFQVVIKEIIYKEELKKDLIPYYLERILPLLRETIEEFKGRGMFRDISADRILKMLLSLIGGYLVSQFILCNSYTINDEEIENIIQFVMNGLRNTHQI